jgi:hypothetical protein
MNRPEIAGPLADRERELAEFWAKALEAHAQRHCRPRVTVTAPPGQRSRGGAVGLQGNRPQILVDVWDGDAADEERAYGTFALSYFFAIAGMHNCASHAWDDPRAGFGVNSWLCQTRESCRPLRELVLRATCMAGVYGGWAEAHGLIDAATVDAMAEQAEWLTPNAADRATGFPLGEARVRRFRDGRAGGWGMARDRPDPLGACPA